MVRKSRKPVRKSNKLPSPIRLAMLVLVLALAVGLSFAILHRHNSATNDGNTTSGSQTSRSSGKNYSTTPLNGNDVNATNDSRKTSSTPSSTLDSSGSSGSLHITLTGVNDVNGVVRVSTLVSGASSGNCQVTASLTGQASVVAYSSVVQNVNSYQCDDFGLKSSQFASGNWHFVVIVSSGQQMATDDNYGNLP